MNFLIRIVSHSSFIFVYILAKYRFRISRSRFPIVKAIIMFGTDGAFVASIIINVSISPREIASAAAGRHIARCFW